MRVKADDRSIISEISTMNENAAAKKKAAARAALSSSSNSGNNNSSNTKATYANTDGYFVYTNSGWRGVDAASEDAERIDTEFPTTFYDIAWFYANVIDYVRVAMW
jgi:hypothetical protein